MKTVLVSVKKEPTFF